MKLFLLHCTFSQSLKWTEEHEFLMLRELMLLQPWLDKKGTGGRGDVWEKLAVSLNAIPGTGIMVNLFASPLIIMNLVVVYLQT